MIAYLPIPGGHIKLAERFVDPAFSFTMGWNYWYSWAVVLPAELSASAVLINYWNKTINNAAWVTIIMVGMLLCSLTYVARLTYFQLVVIVINLFGAGVYGEAEFIFASIKVITITGLIILGIVLDLGGGPDHDRIGFRYWKNPGPFVQYNDIPGVKGRFLGWWAVMTQAAFSYMCILFIRPYTFDSDMEFSGTEIVAIAAGEAKNPRRNLPKAIKRVYIRILLFYIGGVIIIGLLVPSNDKGLNLGSGTAASSPFVIAIQRGSMVKAALSSGIKALPSIINACLLTSAWSAGSSDLYTSSRALYGLAASGNAPRIFLKTLSNGLPIFALAFCASFALFACMGVTSGSSKVFGLMTWSGICLTYLRFYAGMKAQGYDRKLLPFASPLQPFAAWYAMFFCVIICLLGFTDANHPKFSGWSVFLKGNWDTATFVTNYLPFMLFPVIYACAKYYYWRNGKGFAWKRPEDLDFVTDIAEIEADS
ncbi:amino acid permease/ SLC12A domain-containing protein [Mycena olivaceomarginata]|nr:amino acid permease/ SLC12A domain-containing protein [Mycena olivaceomarginata]